MMKKTLLAAAFLSLMAGPALAAHCPADVAKIDEALAGDHGLNEADAAAVQAMRDEGESLHNAGQHGEAVKVLREALDKLGIE